ncbi:MAG TPA: PHP domain-containing protein [Mycobacteriales bacterium]|nr:PHP domain-containing protein [Mycobacteriales bacterium]
MRAGPVLDRDLHTHTTFSDGAGSPADTVAAAVAAGLAEVGVSDHVRAGTDWLPAYTAAVRAVARGAALPVSCGVEAKILDTAGRIDLPADLTGVEYVLLADHRVPLPDGPAHPGDVAAAVAAGRLSAAAVVDLLVGATVRALAGAPRPAGLAHLFSVLPKAGLSEVDIPDDALRALAAACRSAGAWVELNEKWRCPSLRVVRVLQAEGVALNAGSDAHEPAAVGRWSYAGELAAELEPAAG